MAKSSYDSAIEEIKRRLSIIDLIGTYISLKKSGRNYIGLCPFHDDKNPSMQVNDEKGLYHCFSCGAGGDSFTFLMEYRNLTFMEAVEELAGKLNIELAKDRKTGHAASNRSNLLKINNLALRFYHNNLIKNKKSIAGREYLAARGINSETAKEFKLGFANDSWDNLYKLLVDKGVPTGFASEIGLIIRKEGKNDYYDRFRNRVMFPIMDVNGDVIGFGGRVISEKDKPKYLNSPESSLYKKRTTFYGLNNSLEHIKKKGSVVLVEGYTDFLSLFSSGIKNVVATLGTSFTPEHATILKRYTKNVVILYDGDESGIKASFRSGEILLQAGLTPRMVILPNGFDPDRYISEQGPEKLNSLIENSEELTDYYIKTLSKDFNSGNTSRSDFAENLVEFASKIENTVDRTHFIKNCSNVFGFRENDLHSLLNSKSKRPAGTPKVRKSIEEPDSYEMLILKICLKYPELLLGYHPEIIDNFLNDRNVKDIIQKTVSTEYKDINSLINGISDPDSQTLISKAVFSSDDITDIQTAEKMLADCIKRIKLRKIKEQLLYKRNEIQLLGEDSNFEAEKKLLEDYRNLIKEEKQIKSELHNA